MKHSRKLRIGLAALVMLIIPALVAAAPVTVNWWHAMGGALGERINAICEEFNKSQDKYQVIPTFKGNYVDTMNAGVAAFRAKNPPHILQVYEVGTATMMAAKGAVKPVYEVMKESGLPFSPDVYLPTVTGYYTLRVAVARQFEEVYFAVDRDLTDEVSEEDERAVQDADEDGRSAGVVAIDLGRKLTDPARQDAVLRKGRCRSGRR